MKVTKLLVCNLVIASSLLISGIVKAETCYDPDYNRYFYCDGNSSYENDYYEEDNNNAAAAFAFGAVLGAAAGYGAGGGYNHGGHHGGHHGGGGGYHD
jgi:hypothetical protein